MYRFGGRSYVSAGVSTLEQDLYVTQLCLGAGLGRVVRSDGESDDDFAQRMLAGVLESGKAFKLLGGLLVPEGSAPEAWTPEIAQDTAEHFKGLTDEREKTQLFAVLLSLLIGFFPNGLQSSTRSRRSSPVRATMQPDPMAAIGTATGAR